MNREKLPVLGRSAATRGEEDGEPCEVCGLLPVMSREPRSARKPLRREVDSEGERNWDLSGGGGGGGDAVTAAVWGDLPVMED